MAYCLCITNCDMLSAIQHLFFLQHVLGAKRVFAGFLSASFCVAASGATSVRRPKGEGLCP